MWLGNHASAYYYCICTRAYIAMRNRENERGYTITYNLSWKWRLPRTNSKHLDIFLLHENEKSQTTSAPLNRELFAAHTLSHAHADIIESNCWTRKKKMKETRAKGEGSKPKEETNKTRVMDFKVLLLCWETYHAQFIQFVIIIVFILHSVFRWTHSFHSRF